MCSTSHEPVHYTCQHITRVSISVDTAHHPRQHSTRDSTSHEAAYQSRQHITRDHITRCSTSPETAHHTMQHITRDSTSHEAAHHRGRISIETARTARAASRYYRIKSLALQQYRSQHSPRGYTAQDRFLSN